ncbi:MAG: 2-C-methyl-D-erythritol 4-phosphate cytidylyltransferase [Chloroflexia bacterium]|nr:2-C-methyl-D-erythritol 4-phosphate cytidylyltransferase [Chloroflexia bacterium]
MFEGEPVHVLIAAAGQSSRMQGQDKLFALLAGAPLLAHSVERFLQIPLVDRIVLVLRPDIIPQAQQLATARAWPEEMIYCHGGQRRQDSVRLGLEQLRGPAWVLIHDGARPWVTGDLLQRGLEAARSSGAAVPGLPVTDTIKLVSGQEQVEATLPRSRLRAIQTPQVFRLDLIREAHRHFADGEQSFTDDAALLEALQHPIVVFPGDPHNLKITHPQDIRRAEQLWQQEATDE